MAGALTGLLGAGGGGTIGGASVRLVLDTSQFTAGLSKAEGELKGFSGRMQAIGSGMSRVGGALTRGLTLPIVAAGAVATKMALDFNTAFVRIQTLAGDTGQSIAQMKEQVLQLAGQTGQAPTDLANALYQVASAGKAAASQAMPILTQAAKGAALGMGNVNDIASVLTATMNAYGPKTISAAQAMDTLTQATRDSAAEADALATSIGPVIGVAAQVGVSFNDVAAAIATATNQGISAERAATGLRFLLQSLAAPTQTAKDKLDQYGISVQDLGRMLSNQGLQGTLQSLAKTFDLTSARGQQAWKAVVGGARGAVIANTQVGKSAAAAAQEVDNLNHSAGTTEKTFVIWGQTIAGKNAKALGQLQEDAVRLGTQLIPIFEKLVGAVSTLADWFAKLPDGMQSVVVQGLAIAALAGPFLKLGGIVTGLIGKFAALGDAIFGTGVAGGVGGGAEVAAGQLALFGTAATGAGAALATMFTAGIAFVPVAGALATESIASATGMQTEAEKANALFNQYKAGTITLGQVAAQLRGNTQAWAQFHAAEKRAAEVQKGLQSGAKSAGDAIGHVANQVENAAGSFVKAGHATGAVSKGVDQVSGAVHRATGSLGGLSHSTNATAATMSGAAKVANTLTGAIQHIPTKHTTTITANGAQAIGEAHAVAAALNSIPRSITSVVTTVAHQVTAAASHMATGGVIHGATGFVTRAPTYMVGEGNYSTFAGRGAEAVIPLNDRGIGVLSKAMKKAGGGPTINLTINTNGGGKPEDIAQAVSRHLSRVMLQEALV